MIKEARVAADNHDWAGFCCANGGVRCRAGDRPVLLHTSRSSQPGAYGEVVETPDQGSTGRRGYRPDASTDLDIRPGSGI